MRYTGWQKQASEHIELCIRSSVFTLRMYLHFSHESEPLRKLRLRLQGLWLAREMALAMRPKPKW